jgi:uncharacterized protein (DUF2252 family)
MSESNHASSNHAASHQGSPEDLWQLSRDQLYGLAKEHDIEGRSSMSKVELRNAIVSNDAAKTPSSDHLGSAAAASRASAFELLAESAARREFIMLPRLLGGNDRRLHVRQTIREDHHLRISNQSEDARRKFDKLADSVFDFFRGTALLFYRDMVGEDGWMPTVLTLGDVHPGNFGIMPNADNVPIFAVNDFDEAYYAPFTWDLKRGAVGFMLAAQEEGGYGKKKQRKIAGHFVRGYAEGVGRFAQQGGEQLHEVRQDNAPELIRELFTEAKQSRADWLADRYLDEFKRGFRSNDELIPVTSRRDEFQTLIDQLVEQKQVEPPPRAADLHVKDVAIRKGQGTASLGLPRYYVLVEGPLADGSDDLIIEFKKARRSALAGLVPPTANRFDVPGRRIRHAQAVQLVRGDRFYGSIEIEGSSFITRERAPFRDDFDLDDLSKSQWKSYADICGRALAHAHALSDEVGYLNHDVEPAILQAIEPAELFVEDILCFADEAAERIRRDHCFFRADHALGAFRCVDRVYR